MTNIPTIRIFFSSPGDVKMERETARRIVERLQAEIGSRATLEPYFWEHEVMLATRDYQQNIPAMDGFDVVVCILWSRLGSPLNPERHPRPGGGCFESGTEYEFFMAMEAHRSRGLPDVLVFRNRTEPRRPSRPKEAREAVDREIDRLDQFFESYFRTGEYYTVAANSYRTLGEFEEKLTQGLHAFLDQRLPAPGPRARPIATYQGRPYLGLAAFDFADAPVFFGRTAQVGAVVEAFQAQELEARGSEDEGRRFVLVLGASGSGKSSLARAGVLPMLVQPGVIEGAQAWRRAIVKPGAAGGDPFLALAVALLEPEALPELGSDGTNAASLARLLRSQPGGAGMLLRQALNQAAASARAAEELRLRERLRQCEGELREEDAAELRARLARLAPPAVRMALLADQLEELFTTAQTAKDAAAFVECIASIARNGRVFVLGTLRSDFYGSCLAHPRLVELMLGTGTYPLPAPGPSELGQIIRQPAAAAGLVFEEDSANGQKLDELLRDAALRDPAALPLLGYTLEQLYERRTSEGLLTLEAYHALGGLEGAIGRRAEEVFAALPGEAQAAFDPVWRQLVTLGEGGAAVRRRAEQRALCASAGAAALVDALVAARLLTADKSEGGERVLSIAHEALLGHWPRVKEWIEKNREFLSERSRLDERLREWESRKRHKGCLIPHGPALEQAQAILAEHAAVLSAQEIEYIQRSTARAQALERREKLLENGLRLLVVVSLLIGAYAWHERGAALQEKHKAEELAEKARKSEARSAYLLGSEQLESGKKREGLANLAQTLTLDPTHVGARDRLYSYHLYGPPKAIDVRSTLCPAQSRQQGSAGWKDGVQRVACIDAHGAPEIVELPAKRVVPGPWSAAQGLSAAMLNRTGSHLLGQRDEKHYSIWSVDDGGAEHGMEFDQAPVEVACSDDGALLVEGNARGRVRVWDVRANRILHEWTQPAGIECIKLDSARGRLATVGGDVVFFDLAAGRESGRFTDPKLGAQAVRFAEAGDVAVVELRQFSEDGMWMQFVFVDARSGARLPDTREVEVKNVFDFALSREGIAIAVAAFADQAVLYYANEAIPDRPFALITYPTLVRISPDDSQLLVACSDGSVRIFDIGTCELVFEPIQHDDRLDSLTLSWDGRFLLTSTSRYARVWDLAVATALTLPLTRLGLPLACGFDAAGRTLWTASSFSGLQAWDARSLEPQGPALAFGPIASASFDGECTAAVLLLEDETIRRVDLSPGAAAGQPFRAPESDLPEVFSGDGRRAALSVGQVVTCLDTATGKPVGAPWSLRSAALDVQLSYDGSQAAATLAAGGAVLLHDAVRAADYELGTAGTTSRELRFSRDGRWLAAIGTDDRTTQECVLLWDLHAPAAPPHKLVHHDQIKDLCFSADGHWLATGTIGKIAQVWNAETGAMASKPILGTGDGVRLVRFSPDSSRLAVSCLDKTVRLYSWRDSCPVSEVLRLPSNNVDMAFSPDGTQLITICVAPSGSKSLAMVFELTPPAGLPLDLVALIAPGKACAWRSVVMG